MLELTTLTKPGPFGPRTHELGTYIGIRDGARLAAMAGERLKVPGFTEVSAVCTHPDFLGRGYAGILMSKVMQGVRERGETPFLHVREDNTRAIGLYERLGFTTRHKGHFAVLRRIANGRDWSQYRWKSTSTAISTRTGCPSFIAGSNFQEPLHRLNRFFIEPHPKAVQDADVVGRPSVPTIKPSVQTP